MSSYARRIAREALDRQSDRERKATFRSPWSRGRYIEANVDVSELPVRSSTQIHDENGDLLFVFGFSGVGGTDVFGD